MKRIMVISDTHGAKSLVKKAFVMAQNVDLVIHLGDRVSDMRDYKQKSNIIGIKGNCDFGSDMKSIEEADIFGKKFYITHGHLHRVKYDLLRLTMAANEKNTDVVLFGHTHIPYVAMEGKSLFVNPGSIGNPKGYKPKPTFAILEIEDNHVTPSIITIK